MTSSRSTFAFALIAAAAAVLVTGCSNMSVRPADQGPRYYVAAHDSTEGDNCKRVRSHHGNAAVKCLNIPEGEDNVPEAPPARH